MIPHEFTSILAQCNISDYRYFASTPSTNQIAMQWLLEGAPDNAIVFADHQSAGRGRLERRWITQAGSAIAVSILIRPSPAEKEKPTLFSPLAGVALVSILKDKYNLQAQVKWPNDVLIERKKTAGILTEASWVDNALNGLVVGVGINVLSGSLPDSETLQFPATCIQDHTALPINRYQLLADFLQSFQYWRQRLLLPDFQNQWKKMLAFRGETVYIKENNGTVQCSGKLIGINHQGDLQLQSADQSIRTISVGDVHLRPAEPQSTGGLPC